MEYRFFSRNLEAFHSRGPMESIVATLDLCVAMHGKPETRAVPKIGVRMSRCFKNVLDELFVERWCLRSWHLFSRFGGE